MTYGNTWQQGDSCIECQDFETGERVSIEIKPGECAEMATIPRVGGAEESWDELWLGLSEAFPRVDLRMRHSLSVPSESSNFVQHCCIVMKKHTRFYCDVASGAVDKTPVETAQEAYKLGKKLKRGAAVVRDLLDQVFVMTDLGIAVFPPASE